MLAVIDLFMPGLVMNLLRGKFIHSNRDFKRKLRDYILAVSMLNYIMIMIVALFGKYGGNLVYNMNQYVIFSWKYLSGALVLAVAEVILEKIIRNKVIVSFDFHVISLEFKYYKPLVWVYTMVLFGLNAVRIFDHDFWEDEAYSIVKSRMDIFEMLETIAKSDSHPPLYYLICNFVSSIAGESGIVYHLISIVPYAVILILSMTVVWRWFGKEAVVILVTMASLLPSAVAYNVEVRMYVWGELFVFLSFLALYQVLSKGRNKDYVFLALSSLAAAYTHYYCLAAAAFLYLILICEAFISRNKKKISRTAAVCVCTVLGYLPWLGFFILGFQRHVKNFWLTGTLTFKDCIDYIFDTKYGNVLQVFLFVVVFFAFLYQTGFLYIEYQEKLYIKFSLRNVHFTVNCIWLLSGFICIFGTAAAGILVSNVFRPLFVLRYMYPVLIIAWLMLGVCVSFMKLKTIYTIVIIAVMFQSALPEYTSIYVSEKASNESLNETLKETKDLIGQEDIILTNNDFINGSVAECYYPGVKRQMIDQKLKLKRNVQYWLIADWNLADLLMEHEVSIDEGLMEIVNGDLGHVPVGIYKITDKNKAKEVILSLGEY